MAGVGPEVASRPPGHTRRTVLEVRGLTKSFGDHTAVSSVDLDLVEAEVHVLLGENGAGKSTLLNMLYGHLTPDTGTISILGEECQLASPAVALAKGVGMVHQHFTVVPSFTIAENVLLGSPMGIAPRSKRRELEAITSTVERLGWDLDLDARLDSVSVATTQRVEILKLLHRGAEILLLDEPTALLAPTEIDALLKTLTELRSKGTSSILVTHKLGEVKSIADRVTVIRAGKVTAELHNEQIEEGELARAMTGRLEIPEVTVSGTVDRGGKPVLSLRDLVLSGNAQGDGLTFDVHAGEIVAIAGVEGNGQHELFQLLSGQKPCAPGCATFMGVDVAASGPRRLRARGMGIIPADRRSEGVIPSMTLAENVGLNQLIGGRLGWVNHRTLKARADGVIERYNVVPARAEALAGNLSGGNIQKLVIGRELTSEPKLLLTSSPTWGLDVGAVADIRSEIVGARDGGCGVVLISPELDEVLALADRLIVLYRGRALLDVDRAKIDMRAVSMAMIGRVAGATSG
jgi:ABC-type uncharacterized transport system ATPase subunit